MIHLVDVLRAGQVLEEVLTKVLQRGTRRKLVHDQGRRRPGEKDLATVARRHDASGPVDGRTVVVVAVS